MSGRALAQAARRAGWRVLVADFFGDEDTRAAADAWTRLPGNLRDGVDGQGVLRELRQLVLGAPGLDSGPPVPLRERSVASSLPEGAAGPAASLHDEPPVEALILSSGFERLPALVDELAQCFPLAGCGAEAIRRVKDPQWLARACAEIGIPHPDIAFEPPADLGNWLAKTAGGAGGTHVGEAYGRDASPGGYFQKRVRGDSISALFAADGSHAYIAGFSRQWAAPAPGLPYRYGGAVRLRRMELGISKRIGSWLGELTRRAGLAGLCSADFIRNGERWTLIEINPRPGATLDIFDRADAPLIDAHLDAARGRPVKLPRHDMSAASIVAYAKASIEAFPRIDWPDWAADRQFAGSRLGAGDPVCTVFGEGTTATAARRQATNRLRDLECRWSSP